MLKPDGWNHNAHYHDRLLTVAPAECGRALDVGCGLGAFTRRLAVRARQVDALDRDASIIERARVCSLNRSNIRFVQADFMNWKTDASYDVISMIAVLHHLPFREALTKAAELLRPNGRLLVLGLDRPRSVVHLCARSAVAFPLSGYYRLTRGMTRVDAPLAEPMMTLSEIRRDASPMLPGVVVRRHALWRFSMIWTRT